MQHKKSNKIKSVMLCALALLLAVFAAACGGETGPIDGGEIKGNRVIQIVEDQDLTFVNTYTFSGNTIQSFEIEVTSENLAEKLDAMEGTYRAMGFTVIESGADKLVVQASETLVDEYVERYKSKQELAEYLRERTSSEASSSEETSS